jgi:hypothetical protein
MMSVACARLTPAASVFPAAGTSIINCTHYMHKVVRNVLDLINEGFSDNVN